MPVFKGRGKHILYLHTPKTGGTAIEKFFLKNGFEMHLHETGKVPNIYLVRKCPPQHYEAAILSEMLDFSKFDYIFSSVRNPISRIKSEYLMRRSQHRLSDFDLWVSRILEKFRNDPYIVDNHIRPQSDFLVPGSDYYFQEDGFDEKWSSKLSEKIGVEFSVSPGREMVRRDLDGVSLEEVTCSPETQEKIEEFYREDLELLRGR